MFQSELPPGASPLFIVLYADKTELSSFGTKKAYPVFAKIANLPKELRNSRGYAGARLVGWLPVVSSYYLTIDILAHYQMLPFSDFGRPGTISQTRLCQL